MSPQDTTLVKESALPDICPFCEHVIDHCRIVVCEKHQGRAGSEPWTVHARRKGLTTRFFVMGERVGHTVSLDCGIQSGGQDLSAFIVRACNAHEELLAALHFARKYHAMQQQNGRGGFPSQLIGAIEAAIAKAEGRS